MKEYWTSLASIMGVFAFCQTIMAAVFPPELRFAAVKLFYRVFHWCSSYCYFDITEIDGVNTNELYTAVQLYLSTSLSITGTRLSLTRALNSTSTTFGLSNNDAILDRYRGVSVIWEHVVMPRNTQTFSWRPLPEEKRAFTVKIKKRDKSFILDSYLDYIIQTANEIRRNNQDRLLYTNSRGGSMDSRGNPWESVPFKHPSTFDTLAMDPAKKTEITNDLKDFASGETFYKKTGRAWKRGYLLYGPPGTGKSSMIAAMANYLGFDIYDLELTEVHTNSELRKLLMKTSSKSIIVIEDIDCSINLTNRAKSSSSCNNNQMAAIKNQMDSPAIGGGGAEDGGGNSITLSGLLNFTDGLWSCCGSERIFVFTTNHIDKLDPALLRCGRMDMHIFMSYCSFESLKILLKNYLELDESDLDDSIWAEFEGVVDRAEMTPADVSEVLIKNRRDKKKAVNELLQALKLKAAAAAAKKPKRKATGDSGMGTNLSNVEEEEEHEKRALENRNNDSAGVDGDWKENKLPLSPPKAFQAALDNGSGRNKG